MVGGWWSPHNNKVWGSKDRILMNKVKLLKLALNNDFFPRENWFQAVHVQLFWLWWLIMVIENDKVEQLQLVKMSIIAIFCS